MDRPSGSLSKLKIELGNPFASLYSVKSVQSDIVHGRWLAREYVVNSPKTIRVPTQVEALRWT